MAPMDAVICAAKSFQANFYKRLTYSFCLVVNERQTIGEAALLYGVFCPYASRGICCKEHLASGF
jgi:hypothetical protein